MNHGIEFINSKDGTHTQQIESTKASLRRRNKADVRHIVLWFAHIFVNLFEEVMRKIIYFIKPSVPVLSNVLIISINCTCFT